MRNAHDTSYKYFVYFQIGQWYLISFHDTLELYNLQYQFAIIDDAFRLRIPQSAGTETP